MLFFSAWNSYHKKSISRLESVQRRASKIRPSIRPPVRPSIRPSIHYIVQNPSLYSSKPFTIQFKNAYSKIQMPVQLNYVSLDSAKKKESSMLNDCFKIHNNINIILLSNLKYSKHNFFVTFNAALTNEAVFIFILLFLISLKMNKN